MAHEINNPLAVIMQNIQVIRDRITDGLEKNRHAAETCGTNINVIEAYMDARGVYAMINSIMDAGRRAAKIVENMLNLSRKSNMQLAPKTYANYPTMRLIWLQKTII
jgi:signal transduction histidine kinase